MYPPLARETEAQRRNVPWPKPHSWGKAKQALEPCLLILKPIINPEGLPFT